MAPKPPALGAPRRSRDAPRYPHSLCVEVVFGDTDRVVRGAVLVSAQKLVEEGRPLAAQMLEAAAAMYAGGRFTVAGTDRGVGIFEVAAVAEGARGHRP